MGARRQATTVLGALCAALAATAGPAAALDRPVKLMSKPAKGLDSPGAGTWMPWNEQRVLTDAGGREVLGTRAFVVSDQRLAPGDTDDGTDIYRLGDGAPVLMSPGTNAPGYDEYMSLAAVSRDGKTIAWESDADLVPEDDDPGWGETERREGGHENRDTYVFRNGRTSLASRGANEDEDVVFEGMTDDGSRVLFSTRQALVPEDTDTHQWDVYEETEAGVRLISPQRPPGASEDSVLLAGMSGDGRVLVFGSWERWDPADVGDDLDYYAQVDGRIGLISRAGVGPREIGGPEPLIEVAEDGSRVLFATEIAQTPDDHDQSVDVYEWRPSGLRKVSPGNGEFDAFITSFGLEHSADGSRLLLQTEERLSPADRDDQRDVYEVRGGRTTLRSPGKSGAVGTMAPSGRVAIGSGDRLTRDDRDRSGDVFLVAGSGLRRVCAGPLGGNRDGKWAPFVDNGLGTTTNCGYPYFSRNGGHLFFSTHERLTRDDKDGLAKSLYEHFAGRTTLVRLRGNRKTIQGSQGHAGVTSSDGRYIYFGTDERLTKDDKDSLFDVYRATRP